MRRTGTLLVILTAGLAACVDNEVIAPAPGDPAFAASAADRTPRSISLEKVGAFEGGGELAAEITAYDEVSKRLFVVNGALGTVDVVDLRNPSAPVRVGEIRVSALGAGANSVAAHGGVVVLAVEGHDRTAAGTIAFYRATTLQLISSVTVGALPDMVTFTPDGRYVLSANEGEPHTSYAVDPEGSVSVIDVRNINRPTVQTAGFGAWNGRAAELSERGVRIFGPDATVAEDLEPEYIAVSSDSRTAWVTLQENNAMAVIDIASATVTDILPLGYKDHSVAGNGMDASDRDGFVNIRTWPVFGMYQPDAIASYSVGGQTFLVTANEGDARDYAGFEEESRVKDLALNPDVFTSAVCGGSCSLDAQLGRLTVTTTMGYNAATSQYDALYAFGGRSISIWSADGRQVWDSGDDLEQRTASLPNVAFNASNDNGDLDNRSDNKGPEPEGVVLGRLGAKTFAFVGLERVGGIMVYDVSNPYSPRYTTYINTRAGATGDLGPEGVLFIPAVDAPGKEPLLIVGNEVSGTTAVYRINLH